jgi:ABC-type spermidine/putrescine transport system permease subunit II
MRTQVDPTIAAASTLLIIGTILLFALQGFSRSDQKTM